MAQLNLRNSLPFGLTNTQIDSNFTSLQRDGTLAVQSAVAWAPSTAYTLGQILYTLESVYAGGSESIGFLKTGVTYITSSAASVTLTNVAISGTAGTFTCDIASLAVGQAINIRGTNTGTGSITGYLSGAFDVNVYYITATNGSTTFTLSATPGGAAITTVAGTLVGLTITRTTPATAVGAPNNFDGTVFTATGAGLSSAAVGSYKRVVRFYEVTTAGTTTTSAPTWLAPTSSTNGTATLLGIDLPPAYLPADILTKIKLVDGASSGLDADLLDGQQGSYYLDTSSTAQTKTGNLTITGDLIVNGTTTTINSATLVVDDKNIELGSAASGVISTTGTIGSITGTGPWTATITGMSSTTGLIVGSAITATAGTGTLFGGSPTSCLVASIVSSTSITYTVTGGTTPTAGTVTNITSTGITDLTAEGGGITLKAAADKTFLWDRPNNRWTSNIAVAAPTLVSTVATGTAPFSVASTTTVTNLSADLLDGLSSGDFVRLSGTVAETITGNKTFSGTTTFSGATNVNNLMSLGSSTSTNLGPILTLGTISNSGTGYRDGVWTVTPTSNSVGLYGLVTYSIGGGIVRSATLSWGGNRYATAEVLTLPAISTTIPTTATAGNGTFASITVANQTSLAVTGASGTGTVATLTFAAQTIAPYPVGSTIVVYGMNPAGYDTVAAGAVVTACTTTSVSYANATTAAMVTGGTIALLPFVVGGKITVAGVTPTGYNQVDAPVTAITATSAGTVISYANATTGAQTVAGTVAQGTALTNCTIPVSTIQPATLHINRYVSDSIGARIRLEAEDTAVVADQEYGAVVFSGKDASSYGSGDLGLIRGNAMGVSGGCYLDFWTAQNGGAPARNFVIIPGSYRLYNTAGTFYHGFNASATANRTISLPDGNVTLTAGTTVVTDATNQTIAGVKSFSGQVISTAANATANGGGQLYLNGATGNRIDFNTNGVAAPAFTTRSAGTKIVLYPNVNASAVDFAFGIENTTLWSSVASSTDQFKWYAGTTSIATLSGAGVFSPLSISTTGSITARPAAAQDGLIISGRAGGSGTYAITLSPATLTASRAITLPDAAGTVAVSVTDTTTTTQGELNLDFTLSAAGNISAIGTAQGLSTASTPVFAGLRSGSDIVIRGGSGASSEGGQIVLGYGNNTTSTITGQSNNTWNIDVATGVANNDFRIFRQNSSGATLTALQVTESSGDALFAANVTAYSDIRLKKNIVPIDNALEKVGQLTGYTFDRVDIEKRQTGLIAQEVQKVLPEAVVEGENLSLAYGNMVGLLVQAIKELNEKIKVLESNLK